ncbi:MAG: DUF1775 domain-containing protein [Acidimicrobiia bacterium]
MRTTRRVAAVALATAGALVLAAGPAFAHVEADPTRVKPGKEATVEFAPEHGCDESVTTVMDFRVPNGVTDATPEALQGWSATTKGKRIVFTSDSVPDEETSFPITFTAPDKKTVLAWKVIQRCQEGVERWIQGVDGDTPAPMVGVGKNPPGEH